MQGRSFPCRKLAIGILPLSQTFPSLRSEEEAMGPPHSTCSIPYERSVSMWNICLSLGGYQGPRTRDVQPRSPDEEHTGFTQAPLSRLSYSTGRGAIEPLCGGRSQVCRYVPSPPSFPAVGRWLMYLVRRALSLQRCVEFGICHAYAQGPVRAGSSPKLSTHTATRQH